MSLPNDYLERVYAGVLGKIIGVYLGRPFEGWTYEHILAELGEINYYVNEQMKLPLVLTDDDITGTFTFLRALPDYDNNHNLTPQQIGQTWLNYIVEKRAILWWGGLGNSTEHTAYLRLKQGIPAPQSGSAKLNGKVVSEQIGAQIFIDGWAMLVPGDPQRAADLARRAASVSHDGEAIYGAQVIAAMESQAFVEPDLNKLLDTAVTFIPKDSIIYRLIADLRNWCAKFPDWHATRLKIVEQYGYDRYAGNCHMLPNHALIHLGLLYGQDDFQRSLMITNTAGWDTDCNSANVGCIMGIKNGLAGIDAGPDWRTPVADQLYLPTADGGRSITDAVIETYHIVNTGRALAGQAPLAPKNGARFHFSLPGSLQSFRVEDASRLRLENKAGAGLELHYRGVADPCVARACTPTFIQPDSINMPGYTLLASPTLFSGQTVQAAVTARQGSVACSLFIQHYGPDDRLVQVTGPRANLQEGQSFVFEWRIPDLDGAPIAQVGLELSSDTRPDGVLVLDWLTWEGIPGVIFKRPSHNGTMWSRAWVNAVDYFDLWWPEAFRLVQDHGVGMLIQGGRDWQDYQAKAVITPHMVTSFGLAVRLQGLARYYELQLDPAGKVRLVKALDGVRVLAEKDLAVEYGSPYELHLAVKGGHIDAFINGEPVFSFDDINRPLINGGIALVCEEGRIGCNAVSVGPLEAVHG
jgi:ADP-ribosylglycohydrolase